MNHLVTELKNALSEAWSPFDERPYARARVAVDNIKLVDSSAMPESLKTLIEYSENELSLYADDVTRAWIVAARAEVVKNVVVPVVVIRDFASSVRSDVSEFKANVEKAIVYLEGNASAQATILLSKIQAIADLIEDHGPLIESKAPLASYHRDVDRAPKALERIVAGYEREVAELAERTERAKIDATSLFSSSGDVSLSELFNVYAKLKPDIKIKEFDSTNPLDVPDDGTILHPVSFAPSDPEATREILQLVDLLKDLDDFRAPNRHTVPSTASPAFNAFLDKISLDLVPEDQLERLDRCFNLVLIQ